MLNYDKFIYNLIINPVSNFHKDYIDNIKLDINDKIMEIYTVSTNETINNLLSFKKFLDLSNLLFDNKLTSIIINNDDNILIYITKLFNQFNKYLLDKYGNLLTTYNNDTMENLTYDKTQMNCDIEEHEFNKGDELNSDKNDKIIDIMTTNITDLNILSSNNNQLQDSYNIKLYELSQLINELVDNLEYIPINNIGKNLLINFLSEKQEYIIKECTLDIDNIINDINDYCKELSLNYNFDL